MSFQKVLKVLSILVIAIMVIALVNSTTSVVSAAAGTIKLAWGDPFTNSRGQTICMCDDAVDLCLPCYEPVPDQ